MRLPGGGWAWCGDWVVDHHTPGGTDKDGWQYAKDFPASYHPEPGFTDYVRRRVLPLADPGHVTPVLTPDWLQAAVGAAVSAADERPLDQGGHHQAARHQPPALQRQRDRGGEPRLLI